MSVQQRPGCSSDPTNRITNKLGRTHGSWPQRRNPPNKFSPCRFSLQVCHNPTGIKIQVLPTLVTFSEHVIFVIIRLVHPKRIVPEGRSRSCTSSRNIRAPFRSTKHEAPDVKSSAKQRAKRGVHRTTSNAGDRPVSKVGKEDICIATGTMR